MIHNISFFCFGYLFACIVFFIMQEYKKYKGGNS